MRFQRGFISPTISPFVYLLKATGVADLKHELTAERHKFSFAALQIHIAIQHCPKGEHLNPGCVGSLSQANNLNTEDSSVTNSTVTHSALNGTRVNEGAVQLAAQLSNTGSQLIVVEASLPDLDLLLQDLAPPQSVLPVGKDEDAIAAITHTLTTLAQNDTPAESLVILAHGQPGEVLIGNGVISTERLMRRADEISRWRVQNIQLYSCYTGANRQFVDTLSQLSGATVYASQQAVGHETLGGSWLLETTEGIVSTVPFSATSRRQWPFTLAAFAVEARTQGELPPLPPGFDSYAVTIPDGTTSIADFAFQDANVTSVIIPDSVTSIGIQAFFKAPLETVTLGNSVVSIGANSFRETQLTSVTIPDSVTTIDVGAFVLAPITSLTLGDSVETIGTSAFDSTAITSVVIPDTVTEISQQAFARIAQLTSVTIPNSVTSIGFAAFQESGLTSIDIPDSVTSIDNQAFLFTPISEVVINEGVSLASNAFSNTTTIIRRDPSLTATITLSDTMLTGGETSAVTIAFTEAVTDFSAEDLVVDNGTITDLASADGGITWTGILTPANIQDATNQITLTNTYTDLAGNIGNRNIVTSENYTIDAFTRRDGTRRRDTLIGDAGDDLITGFQGADRLTGGGGRDQFIYTSPVDGGDTITDFTLGEDQIVFTELLERLGYAGSDPLADGLVQFRSLGSSTVVAIDPDGFEGAAQARNFLTVEGVAPAALNQADNFIF